jgi:hypothetical protein
MPTQIQTRFTAYEFTPEEFKSAAVVNPMQKMHVQTLIANIAQQIINLDAGTKDQLADFEIQRSYLRGQMDALEHLLQISESMELNIVEEESRKQYVVDVPNSPNLYSQFNQNSDGE